MQRREFCRLNTLHHDFGHNRAKKMSSFAISPKHKFNCNLAQTQNVNATLLLIGLGPYRILIHVSNGESGSAGSTKSCPQSHLQSHHQCAAIFIYILAMLMPSLQSPLKRLHSNPPAIFRVPTIFSLFLATRCAFELMLARYNKMFTIYLCATRDNCLHFWWDYVNNKNKWEKQETLTSNNVEGVRCCVGDVCMRF